MRVPYLCALSCAHAAHVPHMQVSKDLCRLSSELPFDLEECELAMEEDSSGGVDLKKLVKVRACGAWRGVWPD